MYIPFFKGGSGGAEGEGYRTNTVNRHITPILVSTYHPIPSRS
jgi:hypothetical protein